MLFLVSALLTLAFALFSAAALGVRGRIAYLFALYLSAAASLVLVFEILGLARALNDRALFLALQAALALAAGLAWLRRGRPTLLGPLTSNLRRLDFSRVPASMRRHPLLWLFAFAVDVTYAANAYLILIVPPNNNDSLYLHMARVVHWLQGGAFLPYSTPFTLQLYYPFNAQALIYWTVLFWGADQLAGFVQFSAALVTLLGVYALARLLRFTRPQGVFAALLWAAFPQVLFQSSTTQNDLVPAAFMVAGVYFIVRALRGTDPRVSLFLASAGVSLALGAKQTAFFLLPGLALALLLLGWPQRAAIFGLLARSLPLAALTFGLLGAAIYLQNAVVYHNPMGDPQDMYNYIRDPLDRTTSLAEDTQPSALTALWINLNRIAYQFVDTTGLPPFIEGYLFRGKAHFDRALYGFFNLPLESTLAANPNSAITFDFFHRPPPQEDETWFGIFAPLLVVPLGILRLGRSLRRVDPLPAALWGLALSFTFMELLLRPGWDAYLGRNFILAVVFITPFAAAVYRPAWPWQALVALVVALSAYALVTLTLNDTARPLVGQHAIWPLSRAEKLTLQNYYLKDAAVMVEKNVPAEATLALPPGVWEYPFYDPHFTRTLVTPTANDPFADPAWIRREGIQYLLVDLGSPPMLATLPLEGIAASQDWALYRVLP